jgi:hypothetical protein
VVYGYQRPSNEHASTNKVGISCSASASARGSMDVVGTSFSCLVSSRPRCLGCPVQSWPVQVGRVKGLRSGAGGQKRDGVDEARKVVSVSQSRGRMATCCK